MEARLVSIECDQPRPDCQLDPCNLMEWEQLQMRPIVATQDRELLELS